MIKQGLEKILKGFGKGIVTAGLASSLLFFSCSEDSKPTSPANTSPPPTAPTNPTPQPNRPPVITSSPVTSVSEREIYYYLIQATDADGDNLTYSLTKKPSWMTIENNVIRNFPSEVQTNQNFEVEVAVSDGKETAKQNYNLTVKNFLNSYLLSSSQLSGAVVNNNSVSLLQPVSFAVGDIIGSGITSATPNGLLSEITSISSDKKTMQTTQATLEQVTSTSFFSYVGKLNPSSIVYSSLLDGMSMSQSSTKGFNFNIKLTNVVLYDFDGNPNTKSDQLIANGNFAFDTDIIFAANIFNYKINSISFKNTTTIESDVTVGASAIGVASTNKIKIAEFKFNPFIIGYFPPPIPIPIIVVPVLGVYARINPTNVNPLSVRVNHTANLEAWLIYNNTSGWTSGSTFSNNFNFSNPAVNGNLELKVSVGPQLELMLYGVAGPTADINGKLRFKVSNNARDWELYAGLSASVGVKMQILKKGISAQFIEAINYEKLVASYSAPTQPPPSTLAGKIAFDRITGNDSEIYIINPDGSNETNLTNSSSTWELMPSWSPDATKILYSSKPSSRANYDVWIMNADGLNKMRLTSSSSMDNTNASFSPDGKKIAYSAGYMASYYQIHVMNADGSSETNISKDYSHYYWDVSWAPGSRIACHSNRDNSNGEIYTINSDGSDIKRLTNTSSGDRNPAWSPDGTKLAFSSGRDGNCEIYTMNADGSNQKNISNSAITQDEIPTWSSDGNKIAYVSKQVGYSTESYELWIMNADGSNKKRLTNNNYCEFNPSWSKK